MRIVLLSDSHGDPLAVQRAVDRNPTADGFIHLGDGYRDWAFCCPAPAQFFLGVCGNNDWGCQAPLTLCRDFDGVRIFAAHGHNHGVKYGLTRLADAARRENAQVALFGHTHRPCAEFENGLWLINPGSLGYRDPTYCILELSGGRVVNTLHRPLED